MLSGGTLWAMVSVFGLGAVYFIGAIPASVAMKLDPVTAALCAWAGYAAITVAMIAIGDPARDWVAKKLRFSPTPDPTKRFWRVWKHGGLPGLALLAPVTIGPYFAALLALMLGERPVRVLAWIVLAAIPWCILFAALAAAGVALAK